MGEDGAHRGFRRMGEDGEELMEDYESLNPFEYAFKGQMFCLVLPILLTCYAHSQILCVSTHFSGAN